MVTVDPGRGQGIGQAGPQEGKGPGAQWVGYTCNAYTFRKTGCSERPKLRVGTMKKMMRWGIAG